MVSPIKLSLWRQLKSFSLEDSLLAMSNQGRVIFMSTQEYLGPKRMNCAAVTLMTKPAPHRKEGGGVAHAVGFKLGFPSGQQPEE